ncbi:MAG: alpha-amylase, partial [Chloroflexi bacterium]|nr:alpha-amylase [Chloroflexota bacterium]
MRSHPHAYEANALIFLKRASKRHGRDLALSQIPDEEWQRLSKMGFDYIWLMGVWRRSPGARRAALEGEGLRGEYSAALPDWNQDDVVGSPFAVYDYSLDPSLGGPDDLRALKAKLNGLGLRLMLDFVPNHVALDHPWTL